MTTNYASEFVADHPSERKQCIRDLGEPVDCELATRTLAGRDVAVDAAITDDALGYAETLVQAIDPEMKACFTNGLRAAYLDDTGRVTYVEGVAGDSRDEFVCSHAWLEVDGYLVDITIDTFDSYYGVRMDNDTVDEYYQIGDETGTWGVIDNHRTTPRLKFLRDHGYI